MKKLVLSFSFLLICLLKFSVANIGNSLSHLGIYSRDSLVIDTSVTVVGQFLASGGGAGNVNVISDSIYTIDDSLTFVELTTLYNNLVGLTFLTPTITDFDTLTQGNYEISTVNFPNGVFLDGDSNSVFVFHVTGNLNFIQYSYLKTLNVRMSNIFWVVEGSTMFNACSFPGIFISVGNIDVLESNYNQSALLSFQNIYLTDLSESSKFFSELNLFENYYSVSGGCNPPILDCNYIFNGDFEMNTGIPQGTQQFNVCNWQNPSNNTAATPDHFTTSSNPAPNQTPGFLSVNVPNNGLGFQNAFNGGSYVGIFTRGSTPNYREYIQSQLTQVLPAGRYFLSLQISAGDNARLNTDQIGAFFSNGQPIQNGSLPIPVAPQIISTPGQPIADCSNQWVLFTGCFQATGNENWITIGNFLNDNQQFTQQLGCVGSYPDPASAYYYIDDVRLVQIPYAQNLTYTTSCSIPIAIGPNLPQCTANNPFFTYSWSPATHLNDPSILNPSFESTAPGVYNYQLTLGVYGCQDVVYNVSITIPGTPASITGSTLLPCVPNTLMLTANPSSATYLWELVSNPNIFIGTSQSATITHSGTYQVTVSQGACVSTATITITDPVIDLTLDPTELILCSPYAVLINASCPTCISYSWSSNLGTSSSVSVNPTDPISQYTVTGTDMYGCTAVATSTINLVSAPIIGGTIANCKGDEIILTIDNFDPSGSYTWSVTSTAIPVVPLTFPNGEPSEVHFYLDYSSYGFVTLEYNIGGCSGIVNYVVQECCEDDPGSSLSEGDTPDNINNFGNSISNKNNLEFNGTFVVDRDFSFYNCKPMRFAPGAKMLVKSGVTLTIDDCVLQPHNKCCNMWRGIELETGATIVFTKSMITQAEKGILAFNDCILKIKNSEFYSNYIGIDLESKTGIANASLTLENTRIYGDVFACEGSVPGADYFAPTYPAQLTVIGVRPFAGIFARKMNYIDISNSASPVGNIIFENLSNGIVIDEVSQFVVGNSSFTNMIIDNAYSPLVSFANGCGLRSTESRIKFAGLGTANLCLSNCNYGLYIDDSNGNVADVLSDYNVRIGIFITNSLRFTINRNNLKSTLFNVQTRFNRPNALLNIFDNQFSLPTNLATGGGNIFLIESYRTRINVHDNPSIIVNRGGFGIRAFGNENTIIEGNHIDITANGSLGGIIFNGGKDNFIRCNNIQSISGVPDPNQCGISLNITANTEVGRNIVNNENIGLSFNGACDNADIKFNEINNHIRGMSFANAPAVGPQINNSNLWLGTTTFGAFNTITNPSTLFQNRFEYDGSAPIINRPATVNVTSWFVSNFLSDKIIPSHYCTPSAIASSLISSSDYAVANDQLDPNSEFPTQNYESERYLMEKIKSDPTLIQSDPILAAYYNQHLNSNIGYFSEVAIDIKSAMKWQDVYYNVYETNLNLIEVKSDSLFTVMDSLKLDSLNQTLKNLLIVLQEELKSLTISNKNIKEVTDQFKNQEVMNLISENQSLISQDVYENNEIVVNDIYLSTIAVGKKELTETQIINLENIIFQCPFSGGDAVYTARGLYSLINDSIQFDDYSLCVLQGVSPRMAKPKLSINSILYPNPASDKITLKYRVSEEQNTSMRIIDQLGRIMYERKLNFEEHELNIDCSSWNPGIYIFQFVIDGGFKESKLFSVIKEERK